MYRFVSDLGGLFQYFGTNPKSGGPVTGPFWPTGPTKVGQVSVWQAQ
ncbi:MAG: hypothetical protein F6K35_31625 [Okeania sp. SIO2H7]|nr:hypothetical protein [Okeania sp. SIO2H7]